LIWPEPGAARTRRAHSRWHPRQSTWKIWSRLLTGTKVGTVPARSIPVRRIDRAGLDALDPAANHIIRLGHSSHLFKLRGKYWLTLWASWILQSGTERIFYSGDTGYFPGFREIGERMGGFDITLMENGACDTCWPDVHISARC